MPPTPDAHQVLVHDGAGPSALTVVAFLAAPLVRGEAVVVVATPDNRRRFAAGLTASGVDLAGARAAGRYVELDAAATLASFATDDGGPSERLFCVHVVAVVASLAERFGAVSAYGEMVGLLAAEGRLVAALELEDLWSEAMAQLPLRLLCGYPAGALDGGDRVAHVCAAHDLVAPVPSATVAVGLPLDATAGLLARRALVQACRTWGLRDEEWLDDASLIVTELVGNAVRHTASAPALQLDRFDDVVAVLVVDGSARVPGVPAAHALSDSGRGLLVVEALADRWGVQGRPGGKAVWARTRPCPSLQTA